MTSHTVTHATFVIERTYPHPPARVFAAYADPASKSGWFAGPDDWEQGKYDFEFRPGGTEHAAGGPPGGPVHKYYATYHDIVPDERIVLTYEMYLDDARISVSVGTTEFRPDGAGTRLVYTEQGAFLDGYDDAGQREEGTRDLLDALGTYLDEGS